MSAEQMYAGLAQMKTEGKLTGFDGPVTPESEKAYRLAEAVAKAAAFARSAGMSAAKAGEPLKVPADFKAWALHWRLGYRDGKRADGYYWVVAFGDEPKPWQPARWIDEVWWLLGTEIDEIEVAKVGRRLREPGAAS